MAGLPFFYFFSLLLAASPCFGFNCPESGTGNFPNPDDCASFFVCIPTGPVLMPCAGGTLYDPKLQVCNDAELVDCSVGTSTQAPTVTPTTAAPSTSSTVRPTSTLTIPTVPPTSAPTTPSGQPDCPSTGQDFFANPDDCTSYYVCVNGASAIHDCPTGYAFNPDTKLCVPAAEMGCNTLSSTAPPTTPGAPITCPSTGTQLYPHPDQCDSFYLCWNGTLDLITCPIGYEFEVATGHCAPAVDVQCGADGPTSAPAPDCTGRPNGSNFPNPADCSSFYTCSNGHVTESKCAPGLEFNGALEVCDLPANANCKLTAPATINFFKQ